MVVATANGAGQVEEMGHLSLGRAAPAKFPLQSTAVEFFGWVILSPALQGKHGPSTYTTPYRGLWIAEGNPPLTLFRGKPGPYPRV